MKGGFPNRRVQLHLIQSLFSTLKGKVLTRLSPAGWRWHHLERTLVSPYAKDYEYQFKGLHQVLIDAQPTQWVIAISKLMLNSAAYTFDHEQIIIEKSNTGRSDPTHRGDLCHISMRKGLTEEEYERMKKKIMG